MPVVLNVRTATHDQVVDSVLITRMTPWGNPYRVTASRTRAQAVAAFEKYLAANPTLVERARAELRGKNLICYCAPKKCHGDVWLRMVNE